MPTADGCFYEVPHIVLLSIFDDQLADLVVILMVADIYFAFKAVIAFKTEEFLAIRENFVYDISHVASPFRLWAVLPPPLVVYLLSR